jgi:hypothetical protein
MAKKPPTAAERAHLARVGALPCLVCGAQSTVHHVTGYADRMGRIARSHKLIVPLAPQYHQIIYDPVSSDPISVEALGHRGFFKKHGIDLYAEAKRLWDETNGKGNLG